MAIPFLFNCDSKKPSYTRECHLQPEQAKATKALSARSLNTSYQASNASQGETKVIPAESLTLNWMRTRHDSVKHFQLIK
ncbi:MULTISPECIES: hypothetical protein [Acinetobacter]|uniref:hypothetical protein n=1 Tax=Acinetobacter TaxID=469 RepID=UPI0005185BD8|nr:MULTISPECIES: hypothetical protein [Acinetobacter]MCH7317418.1 hypothetical protein [Acinetobacter higginsii]MCH7380299.1 hypothetical protein [Acinetobacter higginsii]MCJ0829795.1 hypothetical protein [Acinetobacter sp. NIPH1876]